MKPIYRTSAISGAIAFVLTANVPARADGIPLNRFDPAPAGDRMFGVPSPTVAGEAVLRAALMLDYAHNPLVFHKTSTDTNVGSVVSSQLFLHLNASLALWNRIGIHFVLPAALEQSGSSPTVSGQAFRSPNAAEIADLRAGIRVRLLGEPDAPFQLAIGGYVWLPTGRSDQYVGDGKVRGAPQLLLGGYCDRIVWSFAAGPQFRATRDFGGVSGGTQMHVGAGLGFLVDAERRLQIGPEIYTAFTLENNHASPNDTFGRASNIQILADARYRFWDDWEMGAGVGPGLGSGIGTPDVRGVLMLAYSPPEVTKKEEPPSDRDGDGITDDKDACRDVKGVPNRDPLLHGCPPDRDGDGIADDMDACPRVEGVPNRDPKLHGCPPDRDGDGITDDKDACPRVKGVANDDPKLHGCPPDRDGDRIIDAEDACPDVKGVANDDPKAHGCPPDGDGDGITDDKDACPDEKGAPDPDPKKNGCPVVHVTEQEIVILEQVQFDTGKAIIKKESGPLLDKVAAVFQQHPEIKNVEVQGHSDSTGPAEFNRRLSHKRAAAVVEALVSRGVASEKLASKGYGPDVPLADNSMPEGRKQNRRVQFKIIGRQSKGNP